MIKKEYVKKITPKLIRESEFDEGILGGTITSFAVQETTLGESIKFSGEFILRVGEKDYIASTAFMPAVGEALMMDAYSSVSREDAKASVEVLFKIWKTDCSSDESPIGYIWHVSPLFSEASENRLDRMLQTVEND